MKTKTITAHLVEKSITEHPNFHLPQYDWGVVKETHYDEYEDEYGVWHEAETIPEDRSGYRPDLDGKSLADFWDYEKGEFLPELGIGLPLGVTTYLSSEFIKTESA